MTSTVSKLALFLKVPGECFHPQTLTDVILLSWVDLRPLPMVRLCSNPAHMHFVIFPFRAGQAKRREVNFILAYFGFFFFFCPIRATPWLCLEHLILAGPGESLLVGCQELNGFSVFSRGLDERC